MSKKIGYVMAYRKGQNNYGTSLQSYALLKILQSLGVEVEIINYIKQLSLLDKVKWVINAYRCRLLNNITDNKQHVPIDYYDNISIRTEAVDEYKLEKFSPFIKNYSGFDSLSKGSKQYDGVIVGSDQVWLPTGLPTKFHNLLFVDNNVRKIAYGSSFGVHDIPHFQKKATGEYLDRFYRIGVREQRGKEIVDSLSHKTAEVVLDPTLLLTREEWDYEIESAIINDNEPYMFCYLISENKEARAKVTELARQKGIKIICIRHLEKYRAIDETYGDEAPYNVGPNEFIKYIRNAEYIVTDSFHCTVFSHIYHKKFLTFYRSSAGRNARNSRIDSLITILGSNPERLYSAGGLRGIDSEVDWDLVDKNLRDLRKSSINFLKESLD